MEAKDRTSSRLYELVVDEEWDCVLGRIGSHPREARYQDEYGTPLHRACAYRAPAGVVDALLDAFPDAATISNYWAYMPLHIACNNPHMDVAVVRRLMELFPAATEIQAFRGSTALHLSCSSLVSDEVTRMLLESNIDAVRMKNNENQTPLRFLSTKFCSELTEMHEEAEGLNVMDQKKRMIWSKVRLLVEASYHGSVSNIRGDKQIVHACFGMTDCPPEIIRVAMKLHQEQLLEADGGGNLPLHIAAAALSGEDLSNEAATSDPLSMLIPNGVYDRNLQGKIPLQLAAENGATWRTGLKALFSATLPFFVCVEADEKLFPSVLVSLMNECPPNALFEMLRAMPFLMKGGLTNSGADGSRI